MDKPYRTTFENQLIELESVDSTNNYAMARIHAGLASYGQAFLAHRQWAGKGQRGKTWISEPGQSINMSLVLDPRPFSLSGQFLLGSAVALGCLFTVREYEDEGWTLKWPNDLYWRDRKAAGILIENIIKGKEWVYAVAGIGMNLNQTAFPPDLPNPISLKQITHKDFSPAALAGRLIAAIGNQIAVLKKEPEAILKGLNESLYKRGEAVKLKQGNHEFETRIKSVNTEGLLVIEDGREFKYGEVEFVFGG